MGVFSILLAHDHYTIDVVVAYFITTRLFWWYHTMANQQVRLFVSLQQTFYPELNRCVTCFKPGRHILSGTQGDGPHQLFYPSVVVQVFPVPGGERSQRRSSQLCEALLLEVAAVGSREIHANRLNLTAIMPAFGRCSLLLAPEVPEGGVVQSRSFLCSILLGRIFRPGAFMGIRQFWL